MTKEAYGHYERKYVGTDLKYGPREDIPKYEDVFVVDGYHNPDTHNLASAACYCLYQLLR
jgi:hypothetical protein